MTLESSLAAALRLYFRGAPRVFFSRIEIEGAEHVPDRGPVLLLPNHLNAFVDPLVVQLGIRRPITITAKRTLAARPLYRALMRLGRVITFYRPRDGAQHADLHGLTEDLARCRSRLAAGEALVIFPEAKSHDDPKLRPFERGAARVAIEFAREHADRNLVMIPVALHYEAKEHFRSRVWLRYAEPLLVARWLAEHPGAGHRELTAEIERRVVAMVEQHGSRRELILSRWTARASIAARARTGTPPAFSEIVRTSRSLAGGRGLRGLARGLRSRLRRIGVEPEHVFLPAEPAEAARIAFGSAATLLALLPFAIWGALHHALPYLLVRSATRRSATLPDLWASGAVFSSLLVFPPYYFLLAGLAAAWLPAAWAAGYAASLPVSGWLALAFRDRWVGDAARLRALARWARNPSLRRSLAAELAELLELLQVAPTRAHATQ